MSIAIVNGGAAHTHFETLNTGTSSAINTTGATIIIVHTSRYSGGGSGSLTLSDLVGGNSNIYTALTEQSDAEGSSRIYYCINPTYTGSGHTFTATGTVIAVSVDVAAFNGINPVYESENGTFNHTAAGSLAPGSRTPSISGALIISGFSAETAQNQTLSITASLAITDQAAGAGGLNENGALAWLEQLVAASINPSWSWSGGATREAAATLAVFVPAAADTLFGQACM